MRPLSLRLFSYLLLALPAICSPADLFGQSEAQSGEEFLEFQRTDKKRRTVRMEVGDRVKYPIQEGERIRDVPGEVISWTDSTLLVRELETNRRAELNLNRISYIRHVKRGRRIAGWILVGLGIATTLLGLLALLVAASLFGGALFLVLWIVLLGLIFSPQVWLFFGLGILLLKSGNRKLDRSRWKWRRLRIVKVKSPAP